MANLYITEFKALAWDARTGSAAPMVRLSDALAAQTIAFGQSSVAFNAFTTAVRVCVDADCHFNVTTKGVVGPNVNMPAGSGDYFGVDLGAGQTLSVIGGLA